MTTQVTGLAGSFASNIASGCSPRSGQPLQQPGFLHNLLQKSKRDCHKGIAHDLAERESPVFVEVVA